MCKSRRLACSLGILAICTFAACAARHPRVAPIDDTALSEADAILATLTLEEKVALTHGNSTMYLAANPAKGIPAELAFSDGTHTVRPEVPRQTFGWLRDPKDMADSATVFPALSALAATWDVDLARRYGEALGEEARARGKDVLLGPGLNLARTPLCGRNYEYFGEDPLLAGKMAAAEIRGIQSRDVAACAKHFALNNQELNRHGVDACPDIRTTRELYLPAFEMAVKEGGLLAVMGAYNKTWGVHASHNAWLNRSILKGEWGFPGFVVTDWGSLGDTVAGALGGTDVEMNMGKSIRYYPRLAEAIRAGKIPEARVDDMARRVLYVQSKLHLLDGRPRHPGSVNTPEHQALAREVGADSIVLLKNDANLLPLAPDTLKNVLVVGEIATKTDCWEGSSAMGKAPYEIPILAGLREALPAAQIHYRPWPTPPTDVTAIPDACLLTENPTRNADRGILERGWLWERFPNERLEGTPGNSGFTRTPGLPPDERGTHFSLRFRTRLKAPETGDYRFALTCDDGARLLIDGKTVLEDWADGRARTRAVTVHLRAGQIYALTVEYRQGTGAAALAFGWRLPSESSVDYTALRAQAQRADAVLLVTGNRKGWGPARECESGDRPDMRLLPRDDAGLDALLGVNPRTVVLVQAGTPVEMPWLDRAPTLLLFSFLGQETGHSVADVLLGKREPAGRLCQTWPKRLQDSPAHALGDYGPARALHKEGLLLGYRWFDAKGIAPAFPFGHGLGYATFAYGTPALETDGEAVTLRVPVTNISQRPGATVLQLYVEPPKASAVPRAPRQLAAFAKLRLAPGETREAILAFGPRALAWWDATLPGWRHEAGTFTLALGTSSRDFIARLPLPRDAWEVYIPAVPVPDATPASLRQLPGEPQK